MKCIRSPPLTGFDLLIGGSMKRRKNKYDPYTLEVNHRITFLDSRGVMQKILVNDEIYQEFNSFELSDLKEMNEYDRHIEHLEQTDETLFLNTRNKYISLEELVLKKMIYEKLYEEIEKLPDIQKRRLKLYYFEEMTLESIAKIEGCSKVAVKYSIDHALKKISKSLKR